MCYSLMQYITLLDLATETRVFWTEYDGSSYSRVRMFSNTSGDVHGAVGSGTLAVSHTQ
jgi:hypothetical protein